jgi:hypothetical protein
MIGSRWGVTDEEVARPFPCDEWADAPTLEAWRGVTVATTSERLWPWVSQVRVAPYAYDWIDNLGRRSPRSLLDLDPPVVGENFTCAGGRRIGRVLSVDAPHQLTGRIGGVVISYVLEPEPGGLTTRLLMKLVARMHRPLGQLLTLGDLPMARRQLLNFKRLAEAESAQ